MDSKIWKDPVWSKVIATGVIALLGLFGTYFFGAWSFIKNNCAVFWSFLFSSTSTPNWLLGIFAIPSLILSFAIFLALKDRIIGSKTLHRPYKDYFNDNFLNLKWSWSYYSDGQITKIHALCPRCDYQIIAKFASSYSAIPRYDFSCDDCGYFPGTVEGSYEEIEQKIKLKIQKNLRTGEWVKKLNAQ